MLLLVLLQGLEPPETAVTRSSAIAVTADRTACSILTLFIVIATSRPLNKKSVHCQSADPTITPDLRLQSAQAAVTRPAQSHRSWHRVIVDKRADSHAHVYLNPNRQTLMAFL